MRFFSSNQNSGGPWGGGTPRPPSKGKDAPKGNGAPPPPNQPPRNEIEDMMRKGQEQLRVLIGGKSTGGSGGGGGGGGGNDSPSMPSIGRSGGLLFLVALVILWLFVSFYRVETSEQSVELFFGKYYKTGEEGLNFAPWPAVSKEIFPVTRENIEDIGVGGGSRSEEGLMLTGDENIVDIDFQVVWNVSDIQKFVFNIAEPRETIRAVSESVMREIVARTDLTPILTTGKSKIASELQTLIQATLDTYESGVTILRVNFDKADPPRSVADAFREVQAAEQRRDTLEKQADAYANKVVAEARGAAAQMLERAEGYRASVVNNAEGETARFLSVLEEYAKAPEVTRKRLYLETLEEVLGGMDKIILDTAQDGQGVVPYLPLNELIKKK